MSAAIVASSNRSSSSSSNTSIQMTTTKQPETNNNNNNGSSSLTETEKSQGNTEPTLTKEDEAQTTESKNSEFPTNGDHHEPSSDDSSRAAKESPPKVQTSIGTALATAGVADEKSDNDSPLPLELSKILLEVTQTGSHSTLPWKYPSACTNHPTASFGHKNQRNLLVRPHASTVASAAASLSRRLNGTYASSPPRKKHRKNGLHVRQRLSGKKRPHLSIRNNPAGSSGTSTALLSPSIPTSGRTSGSSEPDDTSQYDSEGTTTTTNSEMSLERRDPFRAQLQQQPKLQQEEQRLLDSSGNVSATQSTHRHSIAPVSGTPEDTSNNAHYQSLRHAFRIALGLVLDHWYNNYGGYKLSPAEQRRTAIDTGTGDTTTNEDEHSLEQATKTDTNEKGDFSALEIFQQRKERILHMLGGTSMETPDSKTTSSSVGVTDDGPPFTIQRIAEVLTSPQRYYKQTHKLCNCLEKLLLVTSSTSAFGGSTGGDTSQSRLEERELAALADERGRLHTEYRQSRLQRRTSSLSDGETSMNECVDGTGSPKHVAAAGVSDTKTEVSPEKVDEDSADTRNGPREAIPSDSNNVSEAKKREMLEAAARASLRTKFDHVGIDPHSAASTGRSNSPPPPSLSLAAGASGINLPGHGGLLRPQAHDPEHIVRPHSPILFHNAGGDSMHLLQMHHAAAVAGVSPFELMHLGTNTESGSPTLSGRLPSSPSTGLSTNGGGLKEADLESRSSASSDFDSESDDISFDDSASDRSDGSDSGHNNYETSSSGFTAARAMALNRMQQLQQQQQRLQQQQTQMLSLLGNNSNTTSNNNNNDNNHTNSNNSGENMDNHPRSAEDSGGSDSSDMD